MTPGILHPKNRRILGYVIIALALGFLVLPYSFFPQFYIPKANASMGYVGPASIEGWAFMIIGITLLIISVIMIKSSSRTF
jgi:hypothetical protein